MKGITTTKYLFDAALNVRVDFYLDCRLLKDITNDIASSMMGSICVDNGGGSLSKYHCIVLQQNLCTRSVKFRDVMDIVIKSTNFIQSRDDNFRRCCPR